MRKLIAALVICFCAVAVRGDTTVISFSGPGSSGTIAPGLSWSINDDGTFSFGSPGVGAGVLDWPGSLTPGDITDFSITFTGAPRWGDDRPSPQLHKAARAARKAAPYSVAPLHPLPVSFQHSAMVTTRSLSQRQQASL